jgi:2-oxoglutarate ferredoxin oxidoreductase subunit delta
MAKVKIKEDRCKGCEICLYVCPQKILKLSQDLNKKGTTYARVADQSKCTGCGLCFLVCPDACIEIYE